MCDARLLTIQTVLPAPPSARHGAQAARVRFPSPYPHFLLFREKKKCRAVSVDAAGITSRVGSFADVGCHGPGRAPPAPAPAASPSPAPAPVILPSSPLRSTRRPYPTEICDGRWWRPMAPGGGVRGFDDGGPAQYVPHLWSLSLYVHHRS